MMNWMKIFKRGIAVGIIFYLMLWSMQHCIDSIGMLLVLFHFCFLLCTYYSKYEWGVIGLLTKED